MTVFSKIRLKVLCCIVLILSCFSLTHAEVYVSDKFGAYAPISFHNAKAGTLLPIPLAVFDTNAVVTLHLDSTASTFSDVILWVCGEEQKDIFLSGRPAQCLNKSFSSTSSFSLNIIAHEKYWLVIDNKGSLLTSKSLSINSYYLVDVPEDQRSDLKTNLVGALNAISSYFDVAPFDLNVVPCGVSNAFSATKDGDITMCSELASDTHMKKIPLAFTGVFMHELGHTLPNLWGSPHYSNEMAADNFAAALLFIGANFPSLTGQVDEQDVAPEEVIRELIKYFESISNLSTETKAAILGGQHALSIQRINNFKSILVTPKPFVERWVSEIYPHLTILALESIIIDPHIGADLELAARLLRKKKACGSVQLEKCTISEISETP